MHFLLLWIFFSVNPFLLLTINEYELFPLQNEPSQEFIEFQNKKIPIELEGPVKEALSFFPDLEKVEITFEFKETISGSVMQAQPKVLSLLVDAKEKRKYKIKITRELDFGTEIVPIEDIPRDALVGWIGHELGHIMDYITRSSTNMMRFGVKYLLMKQKVIEAELTADSYAIGCGMGHQILATKNYILNNEGFEDDYKEKIKNLYMSPEQILSLQEVFENGELR